MCALIEADRARPGTADHLVAMPGITVLDLDLPAALALAREATWAQAHTRYAAAPGHSAPTERSSPPPTPGAGAASAYGSWM